MKDRALALDPGTAFFQVAEKNDNGEIEFKTIRNVFVELSNYESEEVEQILKQNKWQYVTDGNHFYITGEDSMKVARLFPGIELRRPMKNGVLNKGEDKKMLIMANMIEKAIGKAEDNTSVVCYCVSSPVIDASIDNIFHKNRIEGMIKRLGFIPKSSDEAMGIILSERPVVNLEDGQEIPYSGIAISFGAGRTNVVLAYRGLQVLGMSCNRGGDYIDKKVAEQTDFPISKIISVKENKLDFNNINYDDDIEFALEAYYSNTIEYVFKNFAKKFSEVRSEFDAPLSIILAGGTASPPGFRDKVEQVVNSLDLPFEIKDVKISADPRNSVVKGLLTQAIISQKKMKKDAIDKALE
jgi:hypothetical protein